MKKLLLIVVLGLLLSGNAYALNFKESIGEYEKKNAGVESQIYVMNRCSAVFLFASIKLFENNDLKKGKNFSDASGSMAKYATNILSKTRNIDFDSSFEEIFERTKILQRYYTEDSKELFLKNGKYFSGFILNDLGRCAQTLKVLKEQLGY